jgi:hypothetical protein
MGPRQSRRGIIAWGAPELAASHTLQWGRDNLVAESAQRRKLCVTGLFALTFEHHLLPINGSGLEGCQNAGNSNSGAVERL